MMYHRNYFSESDKRFAILLVNKDGKRRSNPSGVEKDHPLNAGTLLEFTDQELSEGTSFRFRSLDNPDVYLLSCSSNEADVIGNDYNLLLLPIKSLRDRLLVYTDKQLLNDGRSLEATDKIFVRMKDLQTEIEGIIRYKGPVDDTKGIYFGVELKENKGNSDGLCNGHRYFQTASHCAVFVPLNRIRRNQAQWQRSDILRAEGWEINGGHEMEARDFSGHGKSGLHEYGDLKIGDRIVWPSDDGFEKGTVRWIGYLPDEANGSVTIGVDFDNQVGSGTGKYKDHRLFYTKHGHASLIPLMGLIKDTEEEKGNPILNDQQKTLNSFNKNQSLQQQLRGAQPAPRGEVNKSLPAHFMSPSSPRAYMESPGQANGLTHQAYEQQSQNIGKASAQPPKRHGDPTLNVGSMVEVPTKTGPLYGVIQWIGYTEANPTKLTAGLELESDTAFGTDGVFQQKRYFICKPGRAFFLPLARCIRDKRFLALPQAAAASNVLITSPDVAGDIPAPEVPSKEELPQSSVCGKNRGIQGHHNSCYLDSTLFCMFYFTTVFDSIFNRPRKQNDLPEYSEVQRVLKEGIVNPLRKNKYVSSDKVWKLRVLLDKLGTVPGMMGEEKDVEEFLSALLSQIMKADPLLHLSTGEHAYFYQLFMEKDENLLLPTTQKLVELSFLQGNVKLKEVPACLMIQMPRFGKDYKMFHRIVPSLELDITDILENNPRDCIVCGDLAMWECKDCYQVHGQGLNTTAFCNRCKERSHQHTTRRSHRPELIATQLYLPYFQKLKAEEEARRAGQGLDCSDVILPLPRAKMELFAVICIQTSHYVSFVKCGPGLGAPWVFFDSMADRIGEDGGYNIPEVVHVPEMATWLAESNFNELNKDNEKNLPEHLRRILCDGYMCMYQSVDVMMFQ